MPVTVNDVPAPEAAPSPADGVVRLSAAQLVTLPGAGHFTWVENPDDHRTAILSFLDAP
mgnify:CR=1 FL=1